MYVDKPFMLDLSVSIYFVHITCIYISDVKLVIQPLSSEIQDWNVMIMIDLRTGVWNKGYQLIFIPDHYHHYKSVYMQNFTEIRSRCLDQLRSCVMGRSIETIVGR